ncbi:MAG TPA: carbon-nitrogen hydrolase family protein [Kofleriaceae bacterium]|nr:carbon-nitrogen hydrolase family protein [Kofleriaceae bacterium]
MNFRAACAQLCATEDRERNLETAKGLAARAASDGAKLFVLPECFGFLGQNEAAKLAVAEVLSTDNPGPILGAVIDIATRHGMWVIGGGIAERLEDGAANRDTATYNTCAVVSPSGELCARYRKIHLFDVDIPGGATLRESASTVAGDELVTVETPLAKIGLSICYDLRFPELYRQLVCRKGAEVVVVPSAFTAKTGAAHWHTLLCARAIENQCFVLAPGQVGTHNERRRSFGHSLIADPWGDILAEVTDGGDGLAMADIDLSRLAQVRENMPCLSHVAVRF